ncbi:hypothetical protein [Pararhizobium haloflavum]|uniref:hypothetical protein n=1 Tax=Pararhizobium haloflavum TaxID=2037914 RepID=UPI0012FFFEAB|nr:hypothetical protein [Pararhizobium haloflavum]
MTTTTRPRTPVYLLLICLVAVASVAPLLVKENMFPAHDALIHALWQHQFAQMLFSGDLYPRWLSDLNYGFGSPAFFIYPPVVHYLGAALGIVAPDPEAIPARLAWVIALTMAISGAAAYFWLVRALDGRMFAACLGALAYVLSPYHLYVDAYHRFALAELAAFVWPPLTLMLLHIARERRLAVRIGLPLSIAGLLLTHAPSSLVLVPFYVAYAGVLDLRDRRVDALREILLACLLGACLAGFYLGTALSHQGYINNAMLFEPHFFSEEWLFFGQPWRDPEIERSLTYAFSAQLLVCLACAAMALFGENALHRFTALAVLVAVLAVSFLMAAPSTFFWQWDTPLNKIQFPWRMMVVQTLLMALAVGLSLAAWPRGRHLGAAFGATVSAVSLAVLLFVNIGLFTSLTVPLLRDLPAWYTPIEKVIAIPFDAPEYRLAAPDDLETLLPDGVDAAVVAGAGTVQVERWEPRAIALAVTADTDLRILVRKFVYTGWDVDEGGPAATLGELSADVPALTVGVPPGRHRIALTMTPLWQERFGHGASLVGILALLALSVWTRRRPARPD